MATVKQTIEVFEWSPEGSKKVSEFTREVDEAELMTDKEIDDFWCSCPPPADSSHRESNFHDDEWLTDPETGEEYFSKHHYTCRDCGKTTQIG